METNDLASMANALDAAMGDVKPAKDTLESIPDGLYLGKVKESKVGPSERSGHKSMLSLVFEVLAPETVADTNRKVHKTVGRQQGVFFVLIDKDGARNEKKIGAALWAVNELGLAISGPGSGSALIKRAPELVGVVALIRVKKGFADVERRAKPEDMGGLALAAAVSHQGGATLANQGASEPNADVPDF